MNVKMIFYSQSSFVVLLAFSISSGKAQDSTAVKNKTTISGFADAYYRYSFLDPPAADENFNNSTSFTNSHNSFELGMLSVKLEQSFGKVGLVGDLGFGKRAQDFSYNDEKSMLAIKQLYLSYSPVQNITLTGGSWATHIGYELVDAPANRNYSMSYMFSYGPFFHTGLKADIKVGKSGFMLGFVNPTDLKSASFSRKYIIGQYSLKIANDKINMLLNGLAGKMDKNNRNNQVDLVAIGAVSEKISLGYNGTIASAQGLNSTGIWMKANQWWGSAVYLNYDATDILGMTLRTEYFSDEQGITVPFLGTTGGSIRAATFSVNAKVSKLVVIPEVRFENASSQIFAKHSGTSNSSFSFLCGAYYKF